MGLLWAVIWIRWLPEISCNLHNSVFMFVLRLHAWVCRVCVSLNFSNLCFGATSKDRTISIVIVPVLMIVSCVNYKNIKQSQSCTSGAAGLFAVLSIHLVQHVVRVQAGGACSQSSPTETLGSCAITQLAHGWMQQYSVFSFIYQCLCL